VRGIKPVDPLPQGWTLVGDGLDLDGNPFHLRQDVALVDLDVVSGDFETEPSVELSPYCQNVGGAQVEHDGVPALAGTQSYYTGSCGATFRVVRSPGATQLLFEAIADELFSGDDGVAIIPLGAGATQAISKVHFEPNATEPVTISVPLPGEGDDFLATLPSGLWLDSLRTE
jgi:hypothetical protein